MVIYDPRFLIWWGLLLFVLKLSSRRQLDYALRAGGPQVLPNVNQLAQTQQDSLPVNQTLSHYLGHVGPAPLAQLRTHCLRQLIRNKVLDGCRLEGKFVLAVDGTEYLVFAHCHCEHCLVQVHGTTVRYVHPVLEAKLVGPPGLALSMATEFIENPTPATPAPDAPLASLPSYETIKQDCELNAFDRLAVGLKRDFPQTPLCLTGDSLYACGRVVSVCERQGWSYVLTFKEGRTPALWADFEGLLKCSPQNRVVQELPEANGRQVLRWVNQLPYEDSQHQAHTLNALLCEVLDQDGRILQHFAWLTDLVLCAANVAEVAERGGRVRCHIENQGFKDRKSTRLNSSHSRASRMPSSA